MNGKFWIFYNNLDISVIVKPASKVSNSLQKDYEKTILVHKADKTVLSDNDIV